MMKLVVRKIQSCFQGPDALVPVSTLEQVRQGLQYFARMQGSQYWNKKDVLESLYNPSQSFSVSIGKLQEDQDSDQLKKRKVFQVGLVCRIAFLSQALRSKFSKTPSNSKVVKVSFWRSS